MIKNFFNRLETVNPLIFIILFVLNFLVSTGF